MSDNDSIDWGKTSFDGSRREQLRQARTLTVRQRLEALNELFELSKRMQGMPKQTGSGADAVHRVAELHEQRSNYAEGVPESFPAAFQRLTGFAPMRWQTRLYCEYFAKEKIPASLDIPTGLGKTSVMAIWYLARKAGAVLPRRLVYVVDRRAVVDQATTVAEKIKEQSGDTSLRISTLRGQYVDNREWLEDPGEPAIVVGTVDMVGSRLLFSGYGVSRRTRSFHAGLLGSDALLVLDESHLVPPFERLLETIENDATLAPTGEARRKIVPRFRLLSLSATGQDREGELFRLDENKGDLDAEACKRLEAKKRLTIEPAGDRKLEEALAQCAWQISGEGRNPFKILVYCDKREVAEKARDALNKIARSTKIHIESDLFIGARRVRERINAANRLTELGFISGGEFTLDKPAFVFATSAGEVGVDLDADHMVCDLVTWERMVQRLGRVNRLGGENREAEIKIVTIGPKQPAVQKPKPPSSQPPEAPEKPGSLPKGATEEQRANYAIEKTRYQRRSNEYKKRKKDFDKRIKELPEDLKRYQTAWKEYWAYEASVSLLTRLHDDASPWAILTVKRDAEVSPALADQLKKAGTPLPCYPALTQALVDAWSMTSLETHTGRPEVRPWLRGWVDDDTQSTLVWRKYLPIRTAGGTAETNEIKAFFEAAPPHMSEKLETESWRVRAWLEARATALLMAGTFAESDAVGFLFDTSGEFQNRGAICLNQLLKRDDTKQGASQKKELEKLLAGATLVLDARFGGLSDDGLLSNTIDGSPAVADAEGNEDWPVDIGFCVHSTESISETLTIFRFATELSDEGEVHRCLEVTASRNQETRTSEDSRAAATHPQLLEEHEAWAETQALKIASDVNLPGKYPEALAIAARLHDEGKRAMRWQLAFNAPKDGCYAKTKGPLNLPRLASYRHEFGSLLRVEKSLRGEYQLQPLPDNLIDCLKALPEEMQDLVLHLIASHHGRARPVIGIEGCDDAPPSLLKSRACDVALRFARLQRQWGAWGLAWWEGLLRAADQQASRANEKRRQQRG